MLRHTMSGVPNPDRDFLHSVPPEKLIGSAAVVDVSEDPPHLLPVESLLNWEGTHGSIEADEAVIFNFSWHRKWRTGSKEERSWNIGPVPKSTKHRGTESVQPAQRAQPASAQGHCQHDDEARED